MTATAQNRILFVTSRPSQLKEFSDVFSLDNKLSVFSVESSKEAIVAVKDMRPVLVVVDDQVRGVGGLDIIRRLIEENAFIQTAAISDLTDQEFHNRSEGLGILTQLPLVPGRDDALRLIDQLKQVASYQV